MPWSCGSCVPQGNGAAGSWCKERAGTHASLKTQIRQAPAWEQQAGGLRAVTSASSVSQGCETVLRAWGVSASAHVWVGWGGFTEQPRGIISWKCVVVFFFPLLSNFPNTSPGTF